MIYLFHLHNGVIENDQTKGSDAPQHSSEHTNEQGQAFKTSVGD